MSPPSMSTVAAVSRPVAVNVPLIIKAGITSDLDALESEINAIDKSLLKSKQFVKGKEKEWAVLIAVHISEKNKIEKICREHITEFDFSDLTGSPKEI